MPISKKALQELKVLQEKYHLYVRREFPTIERKSLAVKDPEPPLNMPVKPSENVDPEFASIPVPPREVDCKHMHEFREFPYAKRSWWEKKSKEFEADKKEGKVDAKFVDDTLSIPVANEDVLREEKTRHRKKISALDFVKPEPKIYYTTRRYNHWWHNNGTEPDALASVLFFLGGGEFLLIFDTILLLLCGPILLFKLPRARKEAKRKNKEEVEESCEREINSAVRFLKKMNAIYAYNKRINEEIQRRHDEYDAFLKSDAYLAYQEEVKKVSEKRESLEDEYRQEIQKENERRYQDIEGYAESIGYPKKYIRAIDAIISLLEDLRADSLKEAINLYEKEESEREHHEELMRAANQKYQYVVTYYNEYGNKRHTYVQAKDAADAKAQVSGAIEAQLWE